MLIIPSIITADAPPIDPIDTHPPTPPLGDEPPLPVPEDGVQDDKKDNGTIVKITNNTKIKDKTINLLHNTWSYNNNTTEVKINVTGDRVQLLIHSTDAGNVTLDMNFTYGKGKTFIKTKDKEKISYKTSDLNLTFGANTTDFKEIIVVGKEKNSLFPLHWTVNVNSKDGYAISRVNRSILVAGIEIFTLQLFTALNATNGTVALNETYTSGSSSFNISLDLGQVVDKNDYPLTIDPTVIISNEEGVEENGRNIAVNSSGVMFTVYFNDDTSENLEYQISTDGGQTWGSTTAVSHEATDYPRDVSMCVDSNDNLLFIWKDGTNAEKHFKCYWVGNDTWSSKITFDNGSWQVLVPDDSGNTHLLYGDWNGSTKEELMHRVWDGDSWSDKTQIRNDLFGQGNMRMEASINSSGGLHVVWHGFDSSFIWRVFHSNSSDGGTTWTTPLQIDDDLGQAIGPSIAIDSLDNLHVLWQGKNATHNQVQAVYRKFTNSTGTWGTISYLTDDTDVAHGQPSIAVDKNDTIYALWTDDNGDASNHQVAMRKSTDGGSTWDAETQLIDRTDNTRIPIALHYINPSNGIPYRGLMFAYIHEYGGVNPQHAIYYSSDWALGKSFLFSSAHPADLGFSPVLQPWIHVGVNLTGGGSFNLSFWENSTGSWIKRQENNTVTNGTFWWQYTQASSYETVYYWRVQANYSDITESVTYSFTSLYLVNATGETITQCDLFSYVGGSIIPKYDLINDTSNYTMLWEAYRESSGWIADGAGTITLIAGTWYITHRQRTGDTGRGRYMRLDKSTDLTSWSTVWNVSIDDMSPVSVNAIERFSIRYFNNSYFLYFGEDHTGIFDVNYINTSTPEDLEYSLLNSNNWTLILAGAKDPEVHQHNGTYYFHTTLGLYKDDNPEGSSVTYIVDFTQMYKNTYGGGEGNPGYNTGTIMFDNSSGYFIYWRTVMVDFDEDSNVNDILWFFATSGDLENWEPTDRHIKVKNWTADTAALLGYPAYYVSENETVYVTDWKNASNDRGFYLWVYEKPASNYDPVFSNESPENETIGVGLQPWCHITIEDPEGDTFDVTWEENSTGPWVVRQQNLTSSNGTFWWRFLQADGYSTTYYWKVSANDSMNNTTIYHFTTNAPPGFSSEIPVNESSGISLQPWCHVQINDLEGDQFDVNFYENSTSSWLHRQTNSSASNGTFWWLFANASSNSITYYWNVTMDDGITNISATYHFTTKPLDDDDDDDKNGGGGGGGSIIQVSLSYKDSVWGIKFTPVYPTRLEIDSILWTFGDGSSSSRVSPTHWYPDPGEYNVELKISFKGVGGFYTSITTINVNEHSNIQLIIHGLERDDDRVYLRLGYRELVFSEITLFISGCFALVAAVVSIKEKEKYKKRSKESGLSVSLRILAIIWAVIALGLVAWIEFGG